MKVVVRALSVLRLLADAPRGLTLGEVSDQLKLPLASAHRVVGVLEAERFVTRSATNRRYFLGPAVRELSHLEHTRESPLVTPHKAVVTASRVSGETVFLCELVGSRVMCLALAESRHPLRLYVTVGQEMPLHAAASARVLLAWRDVAKARTLLTGIAPLVAYTDDTPSEVDQVMNHLKTVRARGYDVCESELDLNVWAVSAPVRSSTGEARASVTLAAPVQRMSTVHDRDAALRTVISAAEEMAADLGWVKHGYR